MRIEQLKSWRHQKHLVVAVIDDEPTVVEAVRRLHRLGIDQEQISMLALDKVGEEGLTDEISDLLEAGTHAHGWKEVQGMAIGSGIGLVIGLGVFAVPGLGALLLAAGPVLQVVNVLGHMIAGGVGLGMVLGAIFDERVSEEQRAYLRDSLQKGRWLLIVHGDDPLIEQAAPHIQGEHVERIEAF